MPEIPAIPPILPLQEMLRIAKRWSGDQAPKGRQWRLDSLEDTNWFLSEILPMPEAATLDLVEALKDWDSHLERIARSPRSPDIKLFPKNWKSALRKQILLKAEYVARQEKKGGEQLKASETARTADRVEQRQEAATERRPAPSQRPAVPAHPSHCDRPPTLQPRNLCKPISDEDWARGPEFLIAKARAAAQARNQAAEGARHG